MYETVPAASASGLLPVCVVYDLAFCKIEFKEFYVRATPKKRIAVADKKILQYQSFRLPVAEISFFVKSKSKSSFRLNFKDDVLSSNHPRWSRWIIKEQL
ncbi:hypothetical protein DC498_09525 [Terrimonas sp.]|nr:hypothetical protein DC498_09525 [Terrimonas sp.]